MLQWKSRLAALLAALAAVALAVGFGAIELTLADIDLFNWWW